MRKDRINNIIYYIIVFIMVLSPGLFIGIQIYKWRPTHYEKEYVKIRNFKYYPNGTDSKHTLPYVRYDEEMEDGTYETSSRCGGHLTYRVSDNDESYIEYTIGVRKNGKRFRISGAGKIFILKESDITW